MTIYLKELPFAKGRTFLSRKELFSYERKVLFKLFRPNGRTLAQKGLKSHGQSYTGMPCHIIFPSCPPWHSLAQLFARYSTQFLKYQQLFLYFDYTYNTLFALYKLISRTFSLLLFKLTPFSTWYTGTPSDVLFRGSRVKEDRNQLFYVVCLTFVLSYMYFISVRLQIAPICL